MIWLVLMITSTVSWAAESCAHRLGFDAAELAGARVLHQREPSLYATAMVRRASSAARPEERLATWLRALARGDAPVIAAAKSRFFARALTRHVSERFFELQIEIDRNRGVGTTTLDAERRRALERRALRDQRQSLEEWLEYFAADAHYPAWAKYWALAAVTRLSTFDRDNGAFNRRGRGQAAPFPELNREALRQVMTKVTAPGATDLNFARLYGHELRRSVLDPKILARTDGEWRKFDRGQSAEALVASLAGRGTGWCTVGLDTAQSQLNDGDFYVYYSRDDDDRALHPRVAIRMDGDAVAEVRGIGPQQNLDAEMAATTILSEKLAEFGAAGRRFVAANADMRRVTALTRATEFTVDDLRFLYEIDAPIVGFGYGRDPRVNEILKDRDVMADLVAAFRGEVRDDEISLTSAGARRGGIKYHRGSLEWTSTDAEMPRRVSGFVEVHYAHPDDVVHLPEHVGDALILRGLRRIDGLALPKFVGGYFQANHLIEAANVSFKGLNIFLPALRIARNVTFPDDVGDVDLTSLTTAENVTLPRFAGRLLLNALREAPGLVLPAVVHHHLNVSSLRHDRGLTWPRHVGGTLYTTQWCARPPVNARNVQIKYHRLSPVNL